MSRIKNLSKRGFTLIELIVVVIVLGILMAVALPNFFGASNSAKDSAAKQYLTIEYKNAKAIAAGDVTGSGQYPAVNASLVAALNLAEPEIAAVSAVGAPASSSPITVNVASTPTSVTLVTKSASGAVFTLTATNTGGQSIAQS